MNRSGTPFADGCPSQLGHRYQQLEVSPTCLLPTVCRQRTEGATLALQAVDVVGARPQPDRDISLQIAFGIDDLHVVNAG